METLMSTALITGGTSGIGKATAETLRSRGYRVMVTGVDNTTDPGQPEDVVVVQADARSLPDIDRMVDRARETFGTEPTRSGGPAPSSHQTRSTCRA
jgi:NAD(P)-dependent dehydrogenase (short-subunit alcohol dehydrogenase family)